MRDMIFSLPSVQRFLEAHFAGRLKRLEILVRLFFTKGERERLRRKLIVLEIVDELKNRYRCSEKINPFNGSVAHKANACVPADGLFLAEKVTFPPKTQPLHS